ncbi:interleukin-8-like [Narcine bancroftii]|uniref:interleukin-8-like n=1 Tax=Narcine bancroftii TaxID=1343680 RepID=UPI003831FAF3
MWQNWIQQRELLHQEDPSLDISAQSGREMARAASVTVLILLCVVAAQGIPIPGTRGRCQCIRISADPIHPRNIQSLKFTPKGPHCEKAEIIVTLKRQRNRVCVDPDAKWVEALITGKKGARRYNSPK